jgi:chromosome segregation ATPase
MTHPSGRLCEAIVVNNEATSFECIQYLRDNKIRSQLFLPLDTLVVQVRVTRAKKFVR